MSSMPRIPPPRSHQCGGMHGSVRPPWGKSGIRPRRVLVLPTPNVGGACCLVVLLPELNYILTIAGDRATPQNPDPKQNGQWAWLGSPCAVGSDFWSPIGSIYMKFRRKRTLDPVATMAGNQWFQKTNTDLQTLVRSW